MIDKLRQIWPLAVSGIVGFLIAFLFSYNFQAKYTFKKSKSIKNLVRYFLVNLSALVLSWIFSISFFENLNQFLVNSIIFLVFIF